MQESANVGFLGVTSIKKSIVGKVYIIKVDYFYALSESERKNFDFDKSMNNKFEILSLNMIWLFFCNNNSRIK